MIKKDAHLNVLNHVTVLQNFFKSVKQIEHYDICGFYSTPTRFVGCIS